MNIEIEKDHMIITVTGSSLDFKAISINKSNVKEITINLARESVKYELTGLISACYPIIPKVIGTDINVLNNALIKEISNYITKRVHVPSYTEIKVDSQLVYVRKPNIIAAPFNYLICGDRQYEIIQHADNNLTRVSNNELTISASRLQKGFLMILPVDKNIHVVYNIGNRYVCDNSMWNIIKTPFNEKYIVYARIFCPLTNVVDGIRFLMLVQDRWLLSEPIYISNGDLSSSK